MGSRDIEMLTPKMRELYHAFDEKMKAMGIPYMVTCTSRSILEQMALYVQGRLPVWEVNNFRLCASMDLIFESDNQKVTWTLASKHVTNALDVVLDNDYSRAFDIAILKDNKPVWELKIDVNENQILDYGEAGMIGESVGLKWGGRFSSPDRPHFEEPD